MGIFEAIALSCNIIWAVTLLIMIKTVRKEKYEFVSEAVEGSPFLGNLNVDISWFFKLYKHYKAIKGYNPIFWLSITSILLTIVCAIIFLINVFMNEIII